MFYFILGKGGPDQTDTDHNLYRHEQPFPKLSWLTNTDRNVLPK